MFKQNLKIKLKYKDILKLLIGKRVLVKNHLDNSIFKIEKGKDTYITKG